MKPQENVKCKAKQASNFMINWFALKTWPKKKVLVCAKTFDVEKVGVAASSFAHHLEKKPPFCVKINMQCDPLCWLWQARILPLNNYGIRSNAFYIS